MARVLVVDDEGFVRDLIRMYLEGAGHDVSEAEDGRAALEIFRSQPADLVVTDNAMPRMTGAEMIAELRKECPEVKILAMSGLDLGFDDRGNVDRVLRKPFGRADFLTAVSELISE